MATDDAEPVSRPQRSSVADSGFELFTRDELLECEGSKLVVILARCGGRWLPLSPDLSAMQRRLAAVISSGYVVRPSRNAGVEMLVSPFRLEIPKRGDMTRILLRSVRSGDSRRPSREGDEEPDDSSESYRDQPFLLFVDSRLCVRYLPAHAIASARRARSNGAWERLELRAPFNSLCGDDDTAASQAAFVLHGGKSRGRVRYDELNR